jgi:hypothetical protein
MATEAARTGSEVSVPQPGDAEPVTVSVDEALDPAPLCVDCATRADAATGDEDRPRLYAALHAEHLAGADVPVEGSAEASLEEATAQLDQATRSVAQIPDPGEQARARIALAAAWLALYDRQTP